MKSQLSFEQKAWQCDFTPDSPKMLFQHLAHKRGGGSALSPTEKSLFSPKALPHAESAAARLLEAIKQKERIMVFGDFDVDGITTTALLTHALQSLGAAVSYRIPDRERDSHGLKPHHVEEIASKGVSLIITGDCGTGDKAAVERARALGMEVIITDHHLPPAHPSDLPPTPWIVNPHLPESEYPEKNLSGSAVAFKLISLLYQQLFPPEKAERFLKKYLELAAIGLIADCMPLKGEVRLLVQRGLQAMQQSYWGIAALLPPQTPITSESIAFYVAPKLNAASRMGEVMHAVQLFLGARNRFSQRLRYLEKINERRKQALKVMLSDYERYQVVGGDIWWFHGPHWKTGLLGLLASHIAEKHRKMVVVSNEHAEHIHASVRAPEPLHVGDMLQSAKELFLYAGGHEGAGGFRMQKKHFTALKSFFQQYELPKSVPTLFIDAAITIPWVDMGFMAQQESFAPFGVGNPRPTYHLSALRLLKKDFLGDTGEHLRLTFLEESTQRSFQAVSFFKPHWIPKLKEDLRYQAVVEVSPNTWNGKTATQIKLIDLNYF